MTDGIRALMERADGASPGWWLIGIVVVILVCAGWDARDRMTESFWRRE